MESLINFGKLFLEYFAIFFGSVAGFTMALLLLATIVGMCKHKGNEQESAYDKCDDDTKERIAHILMELKKEQEQNNSQK